MRFRGRIRTRRLSLGAKLLLMLLILAIFAMCILTWADLKLRPLVVTAAKSASRSYATTIISGAVERVMAESGQPKLVDVRYSEGAVTSIETDMYAVSRLRTQSALAVSEGLSELEAFDVEVPLGNLTGSMLLGGLGVPVKVRLIPLGDAAVELYSEFIESGINQTLHRIYLRVRVSVNMLAGGEISKLELSNDVCLAESVIVGKVPDAYTAINRFEIDENEENDLNDYAATLP
ncbi:MAG: sporulation protein YunB [Clostridia bacterium]|nr:sporulation protein YunB [Clostridia bacterium]